jgi:hypothetical protein
MTAPPTVGPPAPPPVVTNDPNTSPLSLIVGCKLFITRPGETPPMRKAEILRIRDKRKDRASVIGLGSRRSALSLKKDFEETKQEDVPLTPGGGSADKEYYVHYVEFNKVRRL